MSRKNVNGLMRFYSAVKTVTDPWPPTKIEAERIRRGETPSVRSRRSGRPFTRADLVRTSGLPVRTVTRYIKLARSRGIIKTAGTVGTKGRPRHLYRANVGLLGEAIGKELWPRSERDRIRNRLGAGYRIIPCPPEVVYYGDPTFPVPDLAGFPPRDSLIANLGDIPPDDALILPARVRTGDWSEKEREDAMRTLREALDTIHRAGEVLWGWDYLLVIGPLSVDTGAGLEELLARHGGGKKKRKPRRTRRSTVRVKPRRKR